MTKSINVPKRYEGEMRRERRPEYNEAAIRDYVCKRPGQVITSKMFVDALDGLTTAPVIARKLVQKGKLKRQNVRTGEKGHHYSYTWVNGGTVPPPVDVTHTPPITPSSLRHYTTDYCIKELDKWFTEFANSQPNAEDLHGANRLRVWVHQQQTEAEEQSKPI